MFRIILLCFLTCCSSFIPLKQSDSIVSEDHTQVVEKKTKHNFVKTGSGYYEFGSTDLFAYDFLVGLVDYYVNDLNQPNLSYNNNTPVSNFVLQTNNVYEVFNYGRTLREYYHMFKVSNFVMSKTIDDNNSFPKIHYTWIMSNSSPYDQQLAINWYAQRSDSQRLTIWGVEFSLPTGSLKQYSVNGYDSVSTTYTDANALYTRFMLSELPTGYNSFVGNILISVHTDEYSNGYNAGYDNGLNNGREVGERLGYQAGYAEGEVAGYTNGYNAGVSDTIASGSEAMTIFAGIMDVAFIPVNVFFLMFDYEVFGINIAGFISGLLTIAIVIILMRFIIGRKV